MTNYTVASNTYSLMSYKTTEEIITVSFEFEDQLIAEDVLSAPSVDIQVFSGVDPLPLFMLSGTATVSGSIVTQHIKLGTGGVVYKLICSATGSSGTVYQVQGKLAVLTLTSSIGVQGFFPNGCLNYVYYQYLPIIGGLAPFTAEIISGSIPPDMTFSVEGIFLIIQGLNTTSGTYSFSIEVTDANGETTVTDQTITQTAVQLVGTFTSTVYTGADYFSTLEALYGVEPYVYSISAGALPDALVLDSVTGVISGILLDSGSFTFTYRVTDACGNYFEVISVLTVAAAITFVSAGSDWIDYPNSMSTVAGHIGNGNHWQRASGGIIVGGTNIGNLYNFVYKINPATSVRTWLPLDVPAPNEGYLAAITSDGIWLIIIDVPASDLIVYSYKYNGSTGYELKAGPTTLSVTGYNSAQWIKFAPDNTTFVYAGGGVSGTRSFFGNIDTTTGTITLNSRAQTPGYVMTWDRDMTYYAAVGDGGFLNPNKLYIRTWIGDIVKDSSKSCGTRQGSFIWGLYASTVYYTTGNGDPNYFYAATITAGVIGTGTLYTDVTRTIYTLTLTEDDNFIAAMGFSNGGTFVYRIDHTTGLLSNSYEIFGATNARGTWVRY